MKLSVLIPVYNERDAIEILLKRVEAAPHEKEIILVDGGSTDGTRGILERLVRDHRDQVRLLFHAQNRDKGAAIRSAIGQATGATVTINEEGEEYHPMKCNRALGALFQENLEALGERVEHTPEDQETGSTDVGNVSQVVPTIHPTIALTDRSEVVCHSTAFAEAAGGAAGDRAMLTAAKALAMTAVDLFTDPAALRQVQEAFREA